MFPFWRRRSPHLRSQGVEVRQEPVATATRCSNGLHVNSNDFRKFEDAATAARRLARDSGSCVRVERRGLRYRLLTEARSAEAAVREEPQPYRANTMFWSYVLSEREWNVATKRSTKMPVLRKSYRKRFANIVGSLGEHIAERWFRENDILFTSETQKTTHDYRLRNGLVIDVKTKDRTVPPRLHYECSVPLYNHEHQKPDYYLFISLQRESGEPSFARAFKFAYVLGICGQAALHEKGLRWSTGEVDLSNGTKFCTSCINVPIGELIAPVEAAIVLKRSC